jgi:quinol monooxygenase YgiN
MTRKPNKTFVMYEVWTKSRVVKAKDEYTAYDRFRPKTPEGSGLNLCNWHAVEVKPKRRAK